MVVITEEHRRSHRPRISVASDRQGRPVLRLRGSSGFLMVTALLTHRLQTWCSSKPVSAVPIPAPHGQLSEVH
jgi:hypothetical protein